ncbi:hypothetical protein CHUV0807_1782 [Cardiobacterium hominis]|uniref:Uncharacterized protein n=1 Tax=Cardiobacterium hominis TaxID=2718 RepID=A0A1C3HPG9_9GAMM|nr:hypothetical protein CHUV0807_1782 [Cardiobacterium hominis]
MNPPDYPLPRGGGSGWGQQIIRTATAPPDDVSSFHSPNYQNTTAP